MSLPLCEVCGKRGRAQRPLVRDPDGTWRHTDCRRRKKAPAPSGRKALPGHGYRVL